MLPCFWPAIEFFKINEGKRAVRFGSPVIPFIMLVKPSLDIIGNTNIGVISFQAFYGVGKHC